MIKTGDRVRFLNNGGYLGFENFKDCYGVVVDAPWKDETIHTSVLNSNGSVHKNFQWNPEGFNFSPKNYEKIEEQEK